MQWSKVKTILLAILTVVNGFFGVNLLMRQVHQNTQQNELRQNVTAVLQAEGVQSADTLTVPLRCSTIELAADRDTVAEEHFADSLLTRPTRTEDTDGTVRFAAENGSVSWKSDGTVEAQTSSGQENALPDGRFALRHRAEKLLRAAGVSLRAASWTIQEDTHTAVMTATVNGLPVFGRSLTVSFLQNGGVRISGQWSFGTPYARTVDRERNYGAGDAVLRFARAHKNVHLIRRMEFGYRLEAGATGSLQFVPTWRFDTDKGVCLVNILKTKMEIAG